MAKDTGLKKNIKEPKKVEVKVKETVKKVDAKPNSKPNPKKHRVATKKVVEKEVEKKPKETLANKPIEKVEPVEKEIVDEKEKKVAKLTKKASDDIIPDHHSPLNEQIDEKVYADVVLEGSGNEQIDKMVIPEQKIVPPTIEEFIKRSQEGGENDTKEEKTAPTKNVTEAQVVQEPEVKENVFQKDFKASADSSSSSERLAKVCVRMYKYLWMGVGKLVDITPDTVAKRIEDGKLHESVLNFEIPIQEGVTMTVLEIVQDSSEKVAEITTLGETKENDLLELLTDFFVEKGWGLSKELEIIFEIGEHTIGSTIELVSNRMMLNNVLKSVSKQLIKLDADSEEELIKDAVSEQPKEKAPPPVPPPTQQPRQENIPENATVIDDNNVEIIEPEEQ